MDKTLIFKTGSKWAFKHGINIVSAGYATKKQAHWMTQEFLLTGKLELYPIQQSNKKFFASMGMR